MLNWKKNLMSLSIHIFFSSFFRSCCSLAFSFWWEQYGGLEFSFCGLSFLVKTTWWKSFRSTTFSAKMSPQFRGPLQSPWPVRIFCLWPLKTCKWKLGIWKQLEKSHTHSQPLVKYKFKSFILLTGSHNQFQNYEFEFKKFWPILPVSSRVTKNQVTKSGVYWMRHLVTWILVTLDVIKWSLE